MDLDNRFRPSSGTGGRIILLGDGTEIETDGADTGMFENDDEEKDLDSQVRKFTKDEQAKRDGTPGPGASAGDK
jgi:protein phosphatase 2C family protein 2/3